MTPVKKIKAACERVNASIKGSIDQSNLYSRGLAYEGWEGGYLAGLQDAMLVINRVKPSRKYWDNITDDWS
jgi:hypothetical protein